MTTVTNSLLLAVDLIVLSGLVLWLHHLSPRYGLAPLMSLLAAVVTILHTLGPLGAFVRPSPGLTLVIGSTVLVPAALLGILLIYVVQGTAAARVTIFGMLGVSGLALGLHLVQGEHLAMPGGGNLAGLPGDSPAFVRSAAITLGSLAAFALSLSMIVIVYQAVTNLFPRTPAWVTPGLALLAALWSDTLLFDLVAFGWGGTTVGMPSALAGKTLSALIVWPLAGWYMTRVAPGMPGTALAPERPSLDLLFGTYGRQAETLTLTEDELRQAQSMISTIVSNAPIVFFALDSHAVFTLSEGKGLDALGLQPGEVVGHSALELFPEARDEILQALGGDLVKATRQIGHLTWETTYTPVWGPDGSVIGLTGVATDLTERMRAERALQESERRFRSTFEQAAVGIAHLGLDGRFLRVNDRLAEILGYEPDELLSLTIAAVTHGDDRDPVAARTAECLAGSRDSYTLEQRYLAKDGAVVWANLTVTLLRDDDARPAYFVAVVEDVTDRRATEEQLRQAQKMEVVGQLTGGVAHDFNNLMTVIMGALELARDDVRGLPQVITALESALEATRRGASLTQRLLAFSRKQTLRPTAVNARHMLEEMRDLLATSLGESIALNCEIEPGLWNLAADPSQLENAILNLALNARDAMPDGGRLEIRASNAQVGSSPSGNLASGNYVLLEVIDNGRGMTPETLERAFEPFFTTKDVGKGSGLGLSMVYGFVKQSGGHVFIDSEAGRGTRVRLYMPRGDAGAMEASSTALGQDPVGQGQLILVVEDDAEVRRLVVRLLQRLGYSSLEAEDAEQALALIDQRRDIDLLFTDIVLPGGTTGAALAAEALRRRPGLPVVYTSGYSRDALSKEGRLGPEVELVEKPFEKAELAFALADALGR